jgi:hypothetical protein
MEHIRTVTREFATGDRAVLHLEARSGSVIVEGRASDRVTVDAVVHIWTDISTEADDAAALVERAMEQDGHRVIVRAPSLQSHREGWSAIFGAKGGRIEYRVRVPVRCAVRVLSRSGSIQITGLEGVVHTEAISGKIVVENIKGDVTIVSRSGSVLGERIEGDVVAEARSGKLKLRAVTGSAKIEARSGMLEVEDVGGDARLSASSGMLSIEHVRGKVHARARAGSVKYKGRVIDDVDIEAHAGSITFAVDPAVPFFIDAESHAGSVRSDLPPRPRGSAPPSEGGPRVRLRTHAGSIRLTRWD